MQDAMSILFCYSERYHFHCVATLLPGICEGCNADEVYLFQYHDNSMLLLLLHCYHYATNRIALPLPSCRCHCHWTPHFCSSPRASIFTDVLLMTDIYLPSCKISSPPALAKATLWLMLYWYRLLDFIFHNVDFQLPILHSTILHTPFSSHHIPCFVLSCVFVLTLICRPNVRFWTRNASKLTVSIACRRRSGCIVYWSLIRAISVVGDWPLNESLHCW